MRHIDIRMLEGIKDWPSAQWKQQAQKALDELKNASTPKERAALFDKYNGIWSALKDDLRKLSHGKCWYCEMLINRDYGDIDHFRPKGKVEGVSGHPGYWWLAFEWRNFRFSCKLCNTKEIDKDAEVGDGKGGKGAQFPLIYGELYRISNENAYEEYEDLLDESPLLLDPTEKQDTFLLTFTRDGKPAPRISNENMIGYKRAKASIEIYHLDYVRINRERQDILHRVQRLVKRIKRYQEKWEKEHDSSARTCARDAMHDLTDLISPRTQYSAAARAYLKEYREPGADWDWVDDLLTA